MQSQYSQITGLSGGNAWQWNGVAVCYNANRGKALDMPGLLKSM